MASRVTHTPIYRDLTHLVLQLRMQRKNIAVSERFFWSDFVLRSVYDLLADVHKAYDAITPADRILKLKEFITRLDTLETYIRISREDNVISIKAAANIWLMMDRIGKQLYGWVKSTKDSMPDV